jgi:hypothetical protein
MMLQMPFMRIIMNSSTVLIIWIGGHGQPDEGQR